MWHCMRVHYIHTQQAACIHQYLYRRVHFHPFLLHFWNTNEFDRDYFNNQIQINKWKNSSSSLITPVPVKFLVRPSKPFPNKHQQFFDKGSWGTLCHQSHPSAERCNVMQTQPLRSHIQDYKNTWWYVLAIPAAVSSFHKSRCESIPSFVTTSAVATPTWRIDQSRLKRPEGAVMLNDGIYGCYNTCVQPKGAVTHKHAGHRPEPGGGASGVLTSL